MNKTLLIIFLVSASWFVKAQVASPKLVIMRIVDCYSGSCMGGTTPAIRITEDNGSHRVIELEKFYSKEPKKPNFPADSNLNKIHLELKKYLDEGYEIVGHTKNMWNAAEIFEDYVLVKK